MLATPSPNAAARRILKKIHREHREGEDDKQSHGQQMCKTESLRLS